MNPSAEAFYAAREFLLAHREDYDTAYRDFRWPELDEFNWALDWFDAVAADPDAARSGRCGSSRGRHARRTGPSPSCPRAPTGWPTGCATRGRPRRPDHPDARQPGRALGDHARRDEARRGGHPGDHAAGRVRPARPAGPGRRQARHRRRGRHRQVRRRRGRLHADRGARRAGGLARLRRRRRRARRRSRPDGVTHGSDTLLLYFTSGTTAKPKLVEHTHASYPVGHLSTMYWIGLQPGDVHLNISSPGWAKHAWSNVFAPWNAEACVLVINYARFDAAALLDVLDRCGVTSFCAPPTVWRMLIQADLSALANAAAKVVGRGRAAQPRGDRAGREGLGGADPGRLRADRDHRADRQPARPAGQARARWAGRSRATRSRWSTRRPGSGRDEGEICLDLAAAPARADGRLPRRPRAQRRGDGRTATTTPATSAPATPTATSPTSGAPTTCSRPATTGSARSSWRAC